MNEYIHSKPECPNIFNFVKSTEIVYNVLKCTVDLLGTKNIWIQKHMLPHIDQLNVLQLQHSS